ncbi:MAG: redoxin domain-containing protein, partial [Solirubrobacterales bacterium]
HSLDFTLLADEDHKVAEKYGVWVEKSMYGKKYWGVQRATYVIDSKGKIAHLIEKASPKTHAEDILKLVGETPSTARGRPPRRRSRRATPNPPPPSR